MKLLKPYLLGCLIGDGGLCGNLTFASLDTDIIEKVNSELDFYGYYLKKRSKDPKRSSEYTITPKQSSNIKYAFNYKNKTYFGNEILKALQADGYPITNHDTLLSVVGKSTKTKKSHLLKYFPELANILSCEQIKSSQASLFLNTLDELHLRCRFDEKRIPSYYFQADLETRLELFRGLMDTDGSVSSNKRLEFCVSNELLANDFLKLAITLGYSGKIYEKQPKYFNKKYNELRFGHKAYRVLLNYNENIIPFSCKRKLEMYNKK